MTFKELLFKQLCWIKHILGYFTEKSELSNFFPKRLLATMVFEWAIAYVKINQCYYLQITKLYYYIIWVHFTELYAEHNFFFRFPSQIYTFFYKKMLIK
jgi:hypothetical protein